MEHYSCLEYKSRLMVISNPPEEQLQMNSDQEDYKLTKVIESKMVLMVLVRGQKREPLVPDVPDRDNHHFFQELWRLNFGQKQ